MYIRFKTLRRNERLSTKLGIFQAAIELRDLRKLERYAQQILEGNINWLKTHLKSPQCLKDPENHRAISWFHPRASKPIEKVRAITEILEEHGVHIEMIKTSDPGSIIYEDGWQVVAKPYKS